MLDNSYCLVTDEKGTVVSIEKDLEGVYHPGIISPGFINGHCHTELSHLKGVIPEKTGLTAFVQLVMQHRNVDPEEVRDSIQTAVSTMWQEGIVAVGDICNTIDTASIKKNSPLQWINFIEVSGFVDATAPARFEQAVQVAQSFEQAYIVPHAAYSVSRSLFELIGAHNRNIISIHNQETPEEDLFMHSKAGSFLELYKNLGVRIDGFVPSAQTSLQTWLSYFNTQKIISVHNTFTNEEDVRFAQNHPIWYCLCINANLYIEDALPPIEMLRKNGCKIVLGTDSLASNQRLSILEEMKTIHKHFPQIPVTEILGWATRNGAEALGLKDIGLLEPGFTSGVVRLEELNNGHLCDNTIVTRLI